MGQFRPQHFVHRISESLQLPEDLNRGNLLVSMEGQKRISIENFRAISYYSLEEIRLITGKNKLQITGKCLHIDCYTKEEIEISGKIEKIEYIS